MREKAARVKMALEFLIGAEPHFLGDPVELGNQELPR